MKDAITYGSFDPEQDKRIQDAANLIKRESKKDAAFFAKKNRPTLTENSLLPYVGRYKTSFEELLSKELGMIKAEMQQTQFERSKEEKTKKEQDIETSIQKLDHANQVDRRLLGDKPCPKPRSSKSNMLLIGLLGIVYIGEWIFNSTSFAYFGGNIVSAALIGATVTIIEGILAYAAGKNLAKIEEGTDKPYVQTALYIGANLGIVIAMSVLRTNVGHATSIETPVWVFFLVNIAFLVGSIAFSRQLLASNKEQDADQVTTDLCSKIETRDAEIKRLETEKVKLDADLAQEEKTYLHVISVAKSTKEQIDAHFRDTVEIFKTENLITRGDLGTPVCFYEAVGSITNSKTEKA